MKLQKITSKNTAVVATEKSLSLSVSIGKLEVFFYEKGKARIRVTRDDDTFQRANAAMNAIDITENVSKSKDGFIAQLLREKKSVQVQPFPEWNSAQSYVEFVFTPTFSK